VTFDPCVDLMRTSGRRRRSVARRAAGSLLLVLSVTMLSTAQARPVDVSPASLVELLGGHLARTAPAPDAPILRFVGARRPLTHARTVLPVLGRRSGPGGDLWLRVALPGRPNGTRGWIPAARTMARSTDWRLVVRLATRRLTVLRLDRAVREIRVVVGAPGTPTPRGTFFVEEALWLGHAAPGGPYALATSARSDVLQEFDGGPGQIALHGRDNLWGALGTASSHGCIRMSTADITWLVRRIGGGVPLTIGR
jgi:L,D-transpeptidase catalytic domain